MTNLAQSPSRENTLAEVKQQYEAFKAKGLKLNLTRGKPAPAQLNLSSELLSLPGTSDFTAEDGTDYRNYGSLQRLLETRRLFSGIMEAPPEQIVVSNNASLALMHDYIVYSLLKGTCDNAQP